MFPTLDGKVVAGPTAVDLEDKDDWSVRPEAAAEILPKAVLVHPPLEGAEPIATYAGLRPAGRGVNYAIGRSAACPAARERGGHKVDRPHARRSASPSTCCGLVAELGVPLGDERPLPRRAPAAPATWWRRTAEHRAAA